MEHVDNDRASSQLNDMATMDGGPSKEGNRFKVNAAPPSSSALLSNKDNKTGEPKHRTSKEELKARLSPIQFRVTQLKSTEPPNSGEYNKFNKKGSYHCVVCHEELFKSNTKYESGCGWPAFFAASDEKKLKFVKDYALVGSANLLLLAKNANLVRTEVLCNNCDAHLGHRFDDGPIAKGGKRYCINSAALSFQSAETPMLTDL